MNEDARNEDTVTGRALGTIAVLGLSAAGVGFGIHAVSSAGKKIGKKVIKPIEKKIASRAFKKDIARMGEAVSEGGKFDIKPDETVFVNQGKKAILKNEAYDAVKKGEAFYLPAEEDALVDAGVPVKKTYKQRMAEKNKKAISDAWEQSKEAGEQDAIKQNTFESDMAKARSAWQKGGQAQDAANARRLQDRATTAAAEAYQAEQDALGREIDETIKNMNGTKNVTTGQFKSWADVKKPQPDQMATRHPNAEKTSSSFRNFMSNEDEIEKATQTQFNATIDRRRDSTEAFKYATPDANGLYRTKNKKK